MSSTVIGLISETQKEGQLRPTPLPHLVFLLLLLPYLLVAELALPPLLIHRFFAVQRYLPLT